MTSAADRRERAVFAQTLCYNIRRYQHLTQTSDRQLADALSLNSEQLQNRMLGIEPWSRVEVDQCTQYFKCSFDMLCPDSHQLPE
ncbi:MAG: hypothetical protein F6K00_29915 [Leptolyngbya sp. SIOISBB]|nr:hypothetical protein [Leptolyngbya sp. SIOISBB]